MGIQIDLTGIIMSILTVIFGLIAKYVIPWAKSRLTKDQMELLQGAVKTGVYAAEQMMQTSVGKEKKQYVIDFLSSKGYILDTDAIDPEIDALIEAMVRELKIEQGQTGNAPAA